MSDYMSFYWCKLGAAKALLEMVAQQVQTFPYLHQLSAQRMVQCSDLFKRSATHYKIVYRSTEDDSWLVTNLSTAQAMLFQAFLTEL